MMVVYYENIEFISCKRKTHSHDRKTTFIYLCSASCTWNFEFKMNLFEWERILSIYTWRCKLEHEKSMTGWETTKHKSSTWRQISISWKSISDCCDKSRENRSKPNGRVYFHVSLSRCFKWKTNFFFHTVSAVFRKHGKNGKKNN